MSDHKNIVKKENDSPERVSKRPVITPAVDILENSDEILVVADVPGTTSEGLNIHFDKDQLFIEASAAEENTADAAVPGVHELRLSSDFRARSGDRCRSDHR